jgi:hypothetical protein
MRKIVIMAAALLVALPALAGDHPMGSESGWFDMENCAFCKSLTADPGLLPHITWEVHAISAGMMHVVTVDPAYAESMATASKAMEELGMGIQSGKINPMELDMCGHCMEFGQIMMAGVHTETAKGAAAEVTLFTSDDAALVKRMRTMAERDNKEMAMMTAGHEGHSH